MAADYLEAPGPWVPVIEGKTIHYYDGPIFFIAEIDDVQALVFALPDEVIEGEPYHYIALGLHDDIETIRNMKADRISVADAMCSPEVAIYEMWRDDRYALFGRRVRRLIDDALVPVEGVCLSELLDGSDVSFR